jgi:hypothetical protein
MLNKLLRRSVLLIALTLEMSGLGGTRLSYGKGVGALCASTHCILVPLIATVPPIKVQNLKVGCDHARYNDYLIFSGEVLQLAGKNVENVVVSLRVAISTPMTGTVKIISTTPVFSQTTPEFSNYFSIRQDPNALFDIFRICTDLRITMKAVLTATVDSITYQDAANSNLVRLPALTQRTRDQGCGYLVTAVTNTTSSEIQHIKLIAPTDVFPLEYTIDSLRPSATEVFTSSLLYYNGGNACAPAETGPAFAQGQVLLPLAQPAAP